MNLIDTLGFVAGILTTFSFAFQAIKIIRTKEVEGISLAMYISFLTGVIMWTVYGFIIESTPIIFWNLVTLALTATIIYNILKYRKT